MGDIEKKAGQQQQRRGWLSSRRQDSNGGLAPFGAVYIALLGLGTVGALAVYLLLIAFVPGASGTRLDAMKTALLVVAGSGAGAGLYVQYRKQQTDEAKSALDHANSRRDQDKLFTERYTQAAAQLGNPAAAVRLAGVYALARIADDSQRDRPTCMRVLCAYLRMPYDPDDPKTEPAERQVRLTAQATIAERLRSDHAGFWAGAEIDLSDAYLIEPQFDAITTNSFKATGATYHGTAGFEGATFCGVARFEGATFSEDARFDGAAFSEDARFDGATFAEVVWFGGATFSGDARFEGTRFGADAGFIGATFSEYARFGGATFSGTGLAYGGAMFNGAMLSGGASFAEATFEDARFTGATFGGDAWFEGTTISGDAWFDGTMFSRTAMFGKATFSGRTAMFGGATFSKDHPPAWPMGFAEPVEIRWADPPVPDPGPAPGMDPDPLADPADQAGTT